MGKVLGLPLISVKRYNQPELGSGICSPVLMPIHLIQEAKVRQFHTQQPSRSVVQSHLEFVAKQDSSTSGEGSLF